MSLMTREDMLRELELLPVWTLRSPMPAKLEPALVVPVTLPLDVECAPEVALVEEVMEAVAEEVVEVALPEPQVFRHIGSEDGKYLFVLPDTTAQADAERLLRNIFMAMQVKPRLLEASAHTLEVFAASHAKLIITMGEQATQTLLQTTQAFESLRGKVHAWQGVQLVATYELAHLLQLSTDKAKAWDDLCLAMRTLHDMTAKSA